MDDWSQTPFQAEGEARDVQKAKNQINHPLQMPNQPQNAKVPPGAPTPQYMPISKIAP